MSIVPTIWVSGEMFTQAVGHSEPLNQSAMGASLWRDRDQAPKCTADDLPRRPSATYLWAIRSSVTLASISETWRKIS